MQMKFRLATILWVLTTLCLVLGWIWERHHYERQVEERIETEVAVECTLTAALHKNLFCERLQETASGVRSEESFAKFRREHLIESVIYLFLNEGYATNRETQLENGWTKSTDQNGRTLRFAGKSLYLLKIDSSEQLNRLLIDNEFYFDWHGDQLFDENKEMKSEFRDFVDRSIDEYQSIHGLAQ